MIPSAPESKPLLCDSDYLTPAELRPHANSPPWMHKSTWASLALILLVASIALWWPMDDYVQAIGEIQPISYRLVFAPSTGTLRDILATDGKRVKAGELLARLDGWEVEKRIAQLEADIRLAKEDWELANISARKVEAVPVPSEFLFSPLDIEKQEQVTGIQQDYLKRLQKLEKSGASSPADIMQLRMQLAASEAQLQRSRQAATLLEGSYGISALEEAKQKKEVIQAKIFSLEEGLRLARLDLSRLDILSPTDGSIVSVARLLPGEHVPLGSPLFKIAMEGGTKLRLFASEDRIDKIAPGQLVRFRPRSNPDRMMPPMQGWVERVAKDRDLLAEDHRPPSASTATYQIDVCIAPGQPEPPLGASADAEVVLIRRPFYQLLLQSAQSTR